MKLLLAVTMSPRQHALVDYVRAADRLNHMDADLVSLARPFLADPDLVNKAAAGRAEEINTCIACNQACLDAIFTDRTATCLVNPRAGRELDFVASASASSQRIAVIGAGPAGMSFAIEAANSVAWLWANGKTRTWLPALVLCSSSRLMRRSRFWFTRR